MTNQNRLTEPQMKTIKEMVEVELMKRGFHAKFEVFEEDIRKNGRFFKVRSEKFQTVPVLFKSLQIENFSNSIWSATVESEGKKFPCTKFWIQIDVRYENFTGGTNGTRLFEMNGHFFEEQSYTYDVVIK